MSIDKSEFTLITMAIIIFIICLLIRYVINKRRFNRRGAGGLQHFKNYEQAWLITLAEKILMWITFIIILITLIFTIIVTLF